MLGEPLFWLLHNSYAQLPDIVQQMFAMHGLQTLMPPAQNLVP